MKRILLIFAVLLALILAGTTGYILGIRHTVAIIEAQRPQPKGIPINWCAVCHEWYPEWYCWLGGCRS